MKKVLVIKEHKTTFLDTLDIKVGEKVNIEKKETIYKNWVWVTAKNGISGWMPEEFLEINMDEGLSKEDYDSKELNVKLGEQLSLYREVANWCWVKNSNGKFGWLPKDNIK